MNKLLLLFLFLCALQIVSQDKLGKPFFTGTSSLTFGINEFYTIKPDDGESFIIPTAIFFRFGVGYEFKKKIAISLNAGFDYHWNYAISAFPSYTSLRYNIVEKRNDILFTEVSFGKMWRPSSNYTNGNYYGLGIGYEIAGEKRWNTIVRLDFHRKKINSFKNNRLDSFSFGLGFSFF